MNMQSQVQTQPVWTWADQISTYRFWGLLLLYLLSAMSLVALSNFLPVYFQTEVAKRSAILLAESLIGIGGLLGFYIGWVTARYRSKVMLLILGIMQLLGGLLVTIPSLVTINIFGLVGGFLIGLGTGGIALAVPSIIAGGRGGTEAFVTAFGLMFLLTRIEQSYLPISMGLNIQTFGPHPTIMISVITYMVLGTLFLLPVKSSLFHEAPPKRGYSLTPTRREPLTVAISCIIPFYWLYWLYRAHGEITWLAPSRNILSPRASVLAGIFVPFFSPVIITSLIEALNKRASELGKPSYRQAWVIFLWSFIFFPVALGLVQTAMNKAMAELNPGSPA